MIDLNTLIPSGSGLVLTEAVNINERGEIAANAALPNGDKHSVLLIPCDSEHADVEGCDYDPVDLDALAAGASTNNASLPTIANPRQTPARFAHKVHN